MKKYLFNFWLLLLLLGCESDSPDDPVVTIEAPSEAILIFPYENSECNEGTDITDTESTVLFEWNMAENTDEFELLLTNLTSGEQTSFVTAETKIPIVLQRATPYSWYIISSSNASDSTAQSEIWKFYNAGDAIESYAPFPAEIISPTMSQTLATTTSVTLDWSGSDIENDISGYDVHFDTVNPPSLHTSGISESELNVSVTANTIYYWRVITKDEQGHSSDSGVYQFKID